MRKRDLGAMMLFILCAGIAGAARADDDARVIFKLGHNPPSAFLRTASLYLSFKDGQPQSLSAAPSGDETRFYGQVWKGLCLQVTPETGPDGNAGYMFTFSKDEADKDPLAAKEPLNTPTLREVAASDFRSADNSTTRPLQPGPGTPEDRGPLRIVHYDGFDLTIRVLEFCIGDAVAGKKPYFKSLSCLVTVSETGPIGK